MWYSVKRIAADNYLDEQTALAVAEKSSYATMLAGELHTNTARMGDLVNEIKEAQGIATVAIRHRQMIERFANFSSAI